MFGYPAFFVNGNMIAGTFQDKIVVRLGDDPAIPGAKTAEPFEPMPGRPMTGFYVVPASVVRSPAKLREWVGRAHAHAKALPPKAAKKKQRAPAKKPVSGREVSARRARWTAATRAPASPWRRG